MLLSLQFHDLLIYFISLAAESLTFTVPYFLSGTAAATFLIDILPGAVQYNRVDVAV